MLAGVLFFWLISVKAVADEPLYVHQREIHEGYIDDTGLIILRKNQLWYAGRQDFYPIAFNGVKEEKSTSILTFFLRQWDFLSIGSSSTWPTRNITEQERRLGTLRYYSPVLEMRELDKALGGDFRHYRQLREDEVLFFQRLKNLGQIKFSSVFFNAEVLRAEPEKGFFHDSLKYLFSAGSNFYAFFAEGPRLFYGPINNLREIDLREPFPFDADFIYLKGGGKIQIPRGNLALAYHPDKTTEYISDKSSMIPLMRSLLEFDSCETLERVLVQATH